MDLGDVEDSHTVAIVRGSRHGVDCVATGLEVISRVHGGVCGNWSEEGEATQRGDSLQLQSSRPAGTIGGTVLPT